MNNPCFIPFTRLGLAVFALSVLALPGAIAQPTQEDVVALLKTAQSTAELDQELATSKQPAYSPQQQLEVKILYTLFRGGGDSAYFDTLRADFKKQLPSWNFEEALYFQGASHLKSTALLFDAMQALDSGDDAAFETAIKEALWTDLEQSHEKASELVKIYKGIHHTVPLDTAFTNLEGKQVTIGELVKGQKALYLRYWATWCGPCIHYFPVLTARQKSLPPQGVAVIAVNTELGRGGYGGKPRQAKLLKSEHDMPADMPWLMEADEDALVKKLEVDSVPRSIVIAPDGRVLFNGHPMDARLVQVLAKLDVKLDLHDGDTAEN